MPERRASRYGESGAEAAIGCVWESVGSATGTGVGGCVGWVLDAVWEWRGVEGGVRLQLLWAFGLRQFAWWWCRCWLDYRG